MIKQCKFENVLSMLKEFDYRRQSIYLDFGCSNGDNADYIKELGMTYIGIDHIQENVKILNDRGYEAYVLDFKGDNLDTEFINSKLNNRELGCIALTNILEYSISPDNFLNSIHKLINGKHIPVIISVFNMSKSSNAFKLLCNEVDDFSISVFNENKLMKLCARNGLHMVAKNDIKEEGNTGLVERDILPLMSEASFSKILSQLREGINSGGEVEEFIRLFLPGPCIKIVETQEPVPFLSIITRTTGNRIETLKEVLLCLSGQECIDFELLIMGHNIEMDKEILIKKLINDMPEWICEKIRFIKVNGGNRSTPLNEGFAAARGQYISILDDDDIIFGNWVQSFKDLSKDNYGKILKSVTVRQEYEPVETIYSQKTSRAVTGFIKDYPSEFDYLQMLHHNQCPGLCLAFPSSVFKEFGLRFDESLNTIEDWDFIMRAVFLCGVASTAEVTNIYRWWAKGESSQTLHKQDEWAKNYAYVQNKLDSQYIILPPGNMKRIVYLIDAYNNAFSQPIIKDAEAADLYRINEKRWIADQLLTSNSWKITKPLRWIKGILGQPACIPNLFAATEQEIDELISNIYSSKSWKVTKRFRKDRS